MLSKENFVKNSINNINLKEIWPNNISHFSDLENDYGVITEHYRDVSNNLKGIFCQDSFMKDVFNFYPDRFCIDVTHKYSETDYFMYVFLCEDSNGRNEVISIGLSICDDSEFFLWLLNMFKKHNPNWRKTKIISMDPEIKHKDILRGFFPTPYIIICFHHAYKSFRKGLEIMKIQHALVSEQTQYAIELFKSMYNAHSQAEYELYYQQFVLLHSSIVLYFQEVWLPMQHLWRTGLDFFHENVFSSLNCHLENLDLIFKTIFFHENDVLKFLKKFFIILSIKRFEKPSLTSISNPSMYSRFSVEYRISKTLTPYASKFVIDQFGLSSEIHMDCSILADNYFFDNLGAPVNASISMCQCQFFLFTFLPCRHIFAVRKTLSLNAFDEALIEYNWTMKYYQATLSSLQEAVNNINNINLTDYISRNKFASHLLEFCLPSLFESYQMSEPKLALLTQLINLWKNDKKVCLEFDGFESDEKQSELNCDSSVTDEKVSISPHVCKLESDIADEEATVFTTVSKPMFVSRKIPVSSKVFKMEYSSLNHRNLSAENRSFVSSPLLSEASFRQTKWNFKSKILDGNHVNYAYLCRIICDSKETIIDWLRQMELICTNMLCPTCGCGMTMKLVPRLSDGAVWVCSNETEIKKSCSRRCSVRRGSWFELTNMSFQQILTFCYMWISGFSQNQITTETGISTATYISWNKLNRRVCEECLMEDSTYSSSYRCESPPVSEILKIWLEKCGEEDSFLKFLQDANAMHRKDAVKHSMG